MTIDESTPAGSDVEVAAEQLLVRPYVDENTNPPPDYGQDVEEWADSRPPLPLGSRARHLPGVGHMSRHRGRDREVPVGRHVFRRVGRRSTALLAAGAALMIIGVVVVVVAMTTGGGVAAPGSSVADGPSQADAGPASGHAGSGGTAQPDGHSQPGTTQPGATRDGGSTDLATATPAPGPATTGGAGSPPGAPTPPDPSSPHGGSPSASPVSTLPPPAADLTGRITNAAGLCLSAASEDHVRLWDCDSSAGELWTLAADGTIRALGQCLRPGSGLVRMEDCDGSLAQQWRIGSGQALVNVGSLACLGDPQSSTASGTPQRTATCDGSATQRWVVPAAA